MDRVEGISYPRKLTVRELMAIEEELISKFKYCEEHNGKMLSDALNCKKCISLTGNMLSADLAFSLTEAIMTARL